MSVSFGEEYKQIIIDDNNEIFGHTAFDREIIKSPKSFNEYGEVAAIPGYRATERSVSDFKLRSYEVTFHIYRRVTP